MNKKILSLLLLLELSLTFVCLFSLILGFDGLIFLGLNILLVFFIVWYGYRVNDKLLVSLSIQLLLAGIPNVLSKFFGPAIFFIVLVLIIINSVIMFNLYTNKNT